MTRNMGGGACDAPTGVTLAVNSAIFSLSCSSAVRIAPWVSFFLSLSLSWWFQPFQLDDGRQAIYFPPFLV
jgi:hypothetical protein